MLGQPISVASYNLADEGGSMRKKRLFAFSLMIGLSGSFITLQTDSARIAPAQDAKVKQGGLINGCSDSVIDALDAITGPKASDKNKVIEQFDLPETQKLWDDAQKAMLEFEKRDQYDFAINRWNVAARPIRAGESCLKCHNDKPIARNADGSMVIEGRGNLDLYTFDARSKTPI
jgi:hypothetical protein